MVNHDVFVVGGGPAGLAAAIAARLKGFDVVVADAAQPPIDKACGEGLMPDSLDALRSLGVTFDPEQSFVFRGIRFIGDGGTVAADFPGEPGIAVRRIRLHQLLIDRAQEVGVKLLWRTHVTGLGDIRARWIIGADGENSRVRRWATSGCRAQRIVPLWIPAALSRPPLDRFHGGLLGTRVPDVRHQRWAGRSVRRGAHARSAHAFDAALPRFPELARRLEGAATLAKSAAPSQSLAV